MRVVLEEKGVNTRGMNTNKMRADFDSHADFMNEKSLTMIERYLVEEKCHIVYMLNPIERMWAQSKRYTKAYCKYSIASLHKLIIPVLETVTIENIQNYFRKVWHYNFTYLGLPGGNELEKVVKNNKQVIKSHRSSEHQ